VQDRGDEGRPGWVVALRRAGLAVAVAFGAVAVAVGLSCGPVLAQGVSPNVDPALKAEFDAAFQDMLRDPANLDKTFKYAELAVKVGDFEAAITALERMLLFNPDLPRVRLELGVLYFRLGSYAIAKTYLTRAMEAPDVPADVRERVEVYLAEIDKRLSPHQFAGSVYGGYRYQSNANSGPTSPGVTLFGFPATLSNDATRKKDHNIFLSGNIRYIYDEQAQNGEVIEATGTAYAARQFDQQQLNLLFLEATLGPRAPFMVDYIDGLNIHPYLLVNFVGLEDSRYFAAGGMGMQFSKVWFERLGTDLGFELKEKNYRNNARRPFATQQDGTESEIRLGARYLLTPDDVISGTLAVKWEGAQNDIYSNNEWLTQIGYTKTYDAPFDLGADRWTSSLNLTYAVRRYHINDPAIDPNNRRFDHETRLSFLTAVPVTKDWSLIFNAQRTIVDSSLLIYTYNNNSFSLGASWRF
jgi:tetratricopeptide (TPR) repeat protein